MIANSELSLTLLGLIGINNLGADQILFNEFAKNEECFKKINAENPNILCDGCRKYLYNDGYLQNYTLYHKELANPSIKKNKLDKSRPPIPNFMEKYGQMNQNWASYRALLLKIPWRMKLMFSKAGNTSVLIFPCLASLNTDLDVLELTIRTIFRETDDELLWKGFSNDSEWWNMDVSLMIGNQDLDRQYCVTSEQQPDNISTINQRNLPKLVQELHFEITLKDVTYFFQRKDKKLMFRSAMTTVPLGQKKNLKKITDESNLFRSISSTATGAQFLHATNTIQSVILELNESKNPIKKRALILSLGFIAENPKGAYILMGPDSKYRKQINEIVNEMIKTETSLHTQGVIYTFANMLSKTEEGRKLLARDIYDKPTKWKIYFISKRNLISDEDQYIVLYKDSLQDVQEKQTNYPELWSKFGELIGKEREMTPEQKDLEKKVLYVLQRVLKDKESLQDLGMSFPLQMHNLSPFVFYISQQLVQFRETRKRFFQILKLQLEKHKEFKLPNEQMKGKLTRQLTRA